MPRHSVTAQCQVCKGLYRLVASTGLLRRHGYGSSHPPCSGSGVLPVASSGQRVRIDSVGTEDADILDTAICFSPDYTTPSEDSSISSSSSFSFNEVPHRILKHIPRSVRLKAASVFDSCLRAVVGGSENLSHWYRLLHFPTCLRRPSRGGKRFNLSSQVSAQVDFFDQGNILLDPNEEIRHIRRPNHGKTLIDVGLRMARRASSKLADGDISGAARLLCSTNSYVVPDVSSHQLLSVLHPTGPSDRRPFPLVASSPFQTEVPELLKAIRSFRPGSAGGVDGLLPQHIQDMLQSSIPGTLDQSLTSFVNMVLSGGVPESVRPVFFGGKLHAIRKPNDGLRPIAIGLTLRRLVSKVANRMAVEKCTPILSPLQLGAGISGGAEAMVHASRAFVNSQSPTQAMVKLDFTNAFNSIRRDSVAEAVARHVPKLAAYVACSYASDSILSFGEFVIPSAEGVQQGDPLGPLLFSLALHEVLVESTCSLTVAYLDDVVLGDELDNLLPQIRVFARSTQRIGLSLNYSKCEVVSLSSSARPQWTASDLPFIESDPKEACLLGSPLFTQGVEQALKVHSKNLITAVNRLAHLSAHEAFFLLRNSLSMPRLQYFLRTTPCPNSAEAIVYDSLLHSATISLLNSPIDGRAWSQAKLPVRWGGLGIRTIDSVGLPAFLSSCYSVSTLLSTISSSSSSLEWHNMHLLSMLHTWASRVGDSVPVPSSCSSQRSWDDILSKVSLSELTEGETMVSHARILASNSEHSGDWLHALPSAPLGLRLSDEELRISVGLRLGVPLVVEHICRCGALVLADGHHGLSCARSSGRSSRHTAVNGLIARAFRSIDIPVILEPPGLAREDGKRPDGLTMVPWVQGRSLIWDFTCPDTLAPSHLQSSAASAGSAAEGAERRKTAKYRSLAMAYDFVPIAVPTLGSCGPEATSFFAALGSRLCRESGDMRAACLFRQRVSLAVQRGNAASVLGTFPREIF